MARITGSYYDGKHACMHIAIDNVKVVIDGQEHAVTVEARVRVPHIPGEEITSLKKRLVGEWQKPHKAVNQLNITGNI